MRLAREGVLKSAKSFAGKASRIAAPSAPCMLCLAEAVGVQGWRRSHSRIPFPATRPLAKQAVSR